MKDLELDNLFIKVVSPPLQKEMEMVVRAFNSVSVKFSYLHNGDVLATQNMLMAAFFTDKKLIMEQNEKFHFDETALLTLVSTETKQEIYERVMKEFVNKMDISSLMNEEGE